jgi:hypothetical protein
MVVVEAVESNGRLGDGKGEGHHGDDERDNGAWIGTVIPQELSIVLVPLGLVMPYQGQGVPVRRCHSGEAR